MKFKNPEYQKKHEELCESYKKFSGGRDFEEDFEAYQKSGSPKLPENKEFEERFENWKKSRRGNEQYLLDRIKETDYRKKKSKKPKAKRKVCRCRNEIL